jgi:hypothetical protein
MATPSLPPSQTKLLVRKGFFAFFVTQLLSALNDNFLKNAVVIWISATHAQLFGLSPEVMISLCSGVFIVPFFLFSATAGQLADRHEKPQLIRLIKLAEIVIMAIAAIGLARGDLRLLMILGREQRAGRDGSRIAEELREGEVVCIFPEGRLTKNGAMDGFRSGIERIIKETPVPVVPMALEGLWGSMFSRMPKAEKTQQKRGLRALLKLTIGDAVPASQVSAEMLEGRVRELMTAA